MATTTYIPHTVNVIFENIVWK